jgi:hypothetical protein
MHSEIVAANAVCQIYSDCPRWNRRCRHVGNFVRLPQCYSAHPTQQLNHRALSVLNLGSE